MLTDYHVHLRPDERENTAARFFTAANAERYRETASERGIEELGVAEHVYRFTEALAVWNHPLWVESARDDIDETPAENLKVTTPFDLRLAELLLAAR